MNQLIKKISTLTLTLLLVNIASSKYYYLQKNTAFTTTSSWNSIKTGGGSTPTSMFTSGDTFDLNGYSNNASGSNFNGCTILNSSATGATLTHTTGGTSNTQKIRISVVSNNFSTSNITYNFANTNNTSIVEYINSSATSFTIVPATYSILKLNTSFVGTIFQIQTGTIITIRKEIQMANRIIENYGELIFSSTLSTIGLSSGATINNYYKITDNRSTKVYPFSVIHLSSENINSGNYTASLYIHTANSKLAGDILVNDLEIGYNGFCNILDINGFDLAINNSITLFTIEDPSSGDIIDSSGINASNGSITISNPLIILHNSIFRTKTATYLNTYTSPAYSDVENLIINCSQSGDTVLITSDPYSTGTYYNVLPQIGNCSIISGILKIAGGTLTVTGEYTIASIDGDIIAREFSSDKLDLTNANSKLTISVDGSILSPLSYTAGDFKNNTISQLMLNFTGGGIFTLPENLTITTETDLYDETNLLDINGKILTINGSIISSSAVTDGLLIGSATSSLVCGATGTLYFNQTGTDSTLKNLTINNSKTVDLGNNLKIVGGSSYGVVTVESGATLNTNGYLTLRSHAGGSAMIGNSPGTISGSIMVETFVPATARRYRFLSSPVTGATAVHWRNNGTYTKYKGIQITGGGANWSAQGFDESQTNNPSAFY